MISTLCRHVDGRPASQFCDRISARREAQVGVAIENTCSLTKRGVWRLEIEPELVLKLELGDDRAALVGRGKVEG